MIDKNFIVCVVNDDKIFLLISHESIVMKDKQVNNAFNTVMQRARLADATCSFSFSIPLIWYKKNVCK